ncbi:mycofactocin biosynthesis chaperone MftB [Saccharopolyspora flava]|uniref:Putative mycofactocin binding protein MftB n=1 Tax=Saccharopolyspora flava TaxID=95161 RepID=A0A1I6S1C2_9PSEU|nr:mycofactocin biosynthesis chaperone MftB [Saccharopolyspora flava]SFS70729.1 putative mycofactocin binding protein MftB [Saccharopolyspora flava]
MAAAEFDISRGYRLNPQVALRPEPFGALAYHFGNRKLSFLKVPELVELVRELGEHPSVEDALETLPEQRRPQFRKALASLAASDMIRPQAEPE